MAEITKIEFWNDVGFIDGAVEIPALSAADPINPDITLSPTDPIIPSKDRFFSEIKIKAHYSELLTVSYMRLTIDLKNSLEVDVPHTFYGWVDSVELVSDGSLPNTVIRWHIDEWRTWKSAVSFGSGHIKRRPFIDLASTPIQNYPTIYRKFGSGSYDLYTSQTYGGYTWWYVVFSYNIIATDANNQQYVSQTKVGFFPINSLGAILAKSDGTDQSYALRPSEVDKNWLSTVFEIRPSQINGIWFSDIPPTNTIMYNAGGSYFYKTTSDWDYIRKQYDGNWYGYFEGSPREYNYAYTVTFTDPITADEEHQYSIVGIDGNIIYSLPYGMTVTKVTSGLIVTPTTCCQLFRFDFNNIFENRNSAVGMLALVPCPLIPVLSNAWSEYNYSGERQYDIDMRKLQTETGAVKQAASGIGTGAMMGAFGPGGLLIGGARGAVGGVTNYLVETFWQNDTEQEILDRLKANQSPNVLLSGESCIELVAHNTQIKLYEFVPDDYSAGLITDTRVQFGVSVDELTTSCDTLIRTSAPTGYYNIQNLIISGDIPVSAKRWIREKFRAGVRLI